MENIALLQLQSPQRTEFKAKELMTQLKKNWPYYYGKKQPLEEYTIVMNVRDSKVYKCSYKEGSIIKRQTVFVIRFKNPSNNIGFKMLNDEECDIFLKKFNRFKEKEIVD